MSNSNGAKRGIGCPYAKKCGGCQLQNLPYEEQLNYKQARVIKLLGKFHRVNKIIGMENPYHYRNKVQAAFGVNARGGTVSGIYQSSTHKIVPVDKCMTEDEKADEIIATVKRLIKSFKIKPYNERTETGFLRHVLVKRGFSTGEIMVVLVGTDSIFPKKRSFVNALIEKHPEITTVVFNVNSRFTSMVLGEKEEVLYGEGKIKDTLMGYSFLISPKSFYQINPVQTEKLYKKVIEFAAFTGDETVLDAYCGVGTIGITAAKYIRRVDGAEINADAVKDARKNAALNGIKNISFKCADAGEYITQKANAGEKYDAVILDPPRAGSSRLFLSSLVFSEPKKIIYVSCNPETQRRDLFFLTKNGYKVKKIQPVDMFPHTNHVETVVLMTRTDVGKG